MRSTQGVLRRDNLSGGLNVRDLYLYDEDRNTTEGASEARYCLDVVPSGGGVEKRHGSSLFTTLAASAGLTLFAAESTIPRALVYATTADMYSIDTSGVATQINDVTFSNGRWSMIEAPASGGQGPVYMVNDTNPNRYWTGSGNTAAWTASSGSLPNGSFMIYALNRVWIAGHSTSPSRLWFSDVGDPRVWPAENVVDFDPSDGQSISGLGAVGPYVLVFKQNKTFVVYDDATGAYRLISNKVGCSAWRSITETPAGTFFLGSDRQVYVTDGQTVRQVSQRIAPMLSGKPYDDDSFSGLDPAIANLSAGAYHEGHYYLAVPLVSGSVNDYVLDYKIDDGTWWLHSSDVTMFASWQKTSSDTRSLYGLSSAGPDVTKLYQAGVYKDSGVAFTAQWSSSNMTFGQPSVNHRIRQIYVEGGGKVDLYVSKGEPVTGSSAGTSTASDMFGSVLKAQVFTPGVGRTWSLTFKDASAQSASSVWRVDAFGLAVNRARRS